MAVGAAFKHWSMRLLAPDRVVQRTYEAFKELLGFDGKSHELMAELESLYHEDRPEDLARIRRRYRHFSEAVAGMVTALERMQPGQAAMLREYYAKYDFYIKLILAPPEQFLIPPFILGHDQPVDPKLAGNKSHNLVALKHGLGMRVPEGFTISATTFGVLVAHNQLRPALDLLLAGIDLESFASLDRASQALMTLVQGMEIPDYIADAILAEYDRLSLNCTEASPTVAVRSSALHEDGGHSFAGQYHSLLGVDRSRLLTAYLEVCGSKYSPQALLYRIHAGIGDEEAAMAVVVQRMIDAASSGVVYTCDPTATGTGALLVHAIHGQGLPLVGGETVPDVYCFPADSTEPDEQVAGSHHQHVSAESGQEEKLSAGQRANSNPPLSRDQARILAGMSREIEQFFAGPQDIEWALASDGDLYILQARPLAAEAPHLHAASMAAPPPDLTPLLAGAQRAAGGVAHGIVHHLQPGKSEQIAEQTVLVTRHIPPSLVRLIPKLAAVICEQGSVTGHFATVCREFGVVLLVGARGALATLTEGVEVTVDGFAGCVYQGKVGELLVGSERKAADRESPYRRTLRSMLDYITPLHLLDPSAPEFRPQSCRSLHDIIRYCHEKAVQIMFGLGGISGNTSTHCRKLATDIPLDMYLLDVGGAFADNQPETITPQALHATPFLALWQGLSHPGVDWHNHLHFDWKGFSDVTMSGGISLNVSKEYASYAVVSPDYLNLNMRFGFHFALLDCLCGRVSRANYCQLRFAGGGGDYQGKVVRIALLQRILERLDFEVRIRGDLLDARLMGLAATDLAVVLTQVGRLLGVTKLLDMTLRAEDVDPFVEQFFKESISSSDQ
jgi:pyruvate, water dikinase